MRRRLIQLGLLILAGAIVNVAVAWGIGILHPAFEVRDGRTQTQLLHGERHWQVWTLTGPGREYVMSSQILSANPTSRDDGLPSLPHWWRGERGAPMSWKQDRYAQATGWPTLSMCVLFHPSIGPPWAWETSFVRGGLCVSDVRTCRHPMYNTSRSLPLLLLWPGFAINTMFYAAIMWMLFAAPFALRRRRRIKRGLCPACAYPVGDSEVCTECGKKLLSPSR
jgi:hypothetical protein